MQNVPKSFKSRQELGKVGYATLHYGYGNSTIYYSQSLWYTQLKSL